MYRDVKRVVSVFYLPFKLRRSQNRAQLVRPLMPWTLEETTYHPDHYRRTLASGRVRTIHTGYCPHRELTASQFLSRTLMRNTGKTATHGPWKQMSLSKSKRRPTDVHFPFDQSMTMT